MTLSWKDLKTNLDIQEAADALRRSARYDELKRALWQCPKQGKRAQDRLR